MKSNLNKLIVSLGFFPNDAFYTVTVDNYNIKLQGEFSPEIIKIARANKFKNERVDSSGYLCLTRSNIEIVLTD